MEVAFEQRQDLGERVLFVRLSERHVTFGIGIVTEHVGDLFENQDHADRRQQSLDHTGGKKGGQFTGPRKTHPDLEDAADHDGQKKRVERTEIGHLRRDDCGQARGRATDARV